MPQKIIIPILLIGSIALSTNAFGKELTSEEIQATKNANNPIANMQAVSFHDYYLADLTDTDEKGNQFWLRYATPVSIGKTNWLLRASLPTYTMPSPYSNDGTETGLGDLNIIMPYLIDGFDGIAMGIGPQLTLPTATKDELGTEKWSAGLSAVFFNMRSKIIQYGGLITWQDSFAGNDDRPDFDFTTVQPFIFFQVGGGYYLRSSGIISYNGTTDHYNVPIGLGVGKVMKSGKEVYNLFIEPQWSIDNKGPNQADFQVFIGFNVQFQS